MDDFTQKVSFTVNGRPRTVRTRPDRRLLDLLREDLGLTGVKEGCGIGECGACTVILDGRPVNSCLVYAFQAEGTAITTVEGLGDAEHLHPVQEAFLDATAVQCGYCTPGMITAVSNLVAENPDLTREEARTLLSGNICRCTGYGQILDAVEQATGRRSAEAAPGDGVGRSVRRVDALEKVTGTCRFTADLPVPEHCLHGVTVRAEFVHARIRAIHTAAALEVPGVVEVLTHEHVPGELHYGNAVADQPVLARDRIRFWGEAVAVVLAEDPSAARIGAERVEVEAEPLPPLLSAEQALDEAAPALHDGGNLLAHQKLHKGDVEPAFEAAAHVVEREYRTGAQEHLSLEPEAALALPDADGGITLKAPSQNVFFDRLHLCRTLGLPRKQVRVVQQPTGAAFGGREDLYAQIHAALGAHVTGRPVRIVWTREETQVATTKRHPARMRYRAALDEDGQIQALHIDVLADTGAYASWAPNIARKMLVHAAGPYEIPNVRVDVRMVYTNNGISGAFRGFGAPQVAFASESFMDEVARHLDRDPVAFRRRHHLEVGRTTATGQTITGSCGLTECVDRALEASRERRRNPDPPPPHIARGRGLSTIFYGIGYGNAIPDIGSAITELEPDGSFTVRCGAVDYGQGALTVFTQIACEVLGVPRDRVRVVSGDSGQTPDSGSTVASRQTYMSGEAVRQSAERLASSLLDLGAERFGRPRSGVVLGERGISDAETGRCLVGPDRLHALCTEHGVRTRRQARVRARTTKLDLETGQGDAYWPYAFAAHLVEVEVDLRTGQVRVVDIIAAHDVGKAINPAMVEGQVAGGVAQGLGFALFEEHILENGVPLTRNLDTYRVPGACDVPDIHPILVEDPEPTGPYGAKGVGEPTLVAVAPAIANAIHDATGIRIRRLPLRPERIRRGLLEAARSRTPSRKA